MKLLSCSSEQNSKAPSLPILSMAMNMLSMVENLHSEFNELFGFISSTLSSDAHKSAEDITSLAVLFEGVDIAVKVYSSLTFVGEFNRFNQDLFSSLIFKSMAVIAGLALADE
uniref:Uncharacterized protein n=1 Tax=Glossina austeni TaxID=7395 RepID=A0A1A9V7G5_GLOAU